MNKIAFFSFADIDNFGDILFSHVFKMEIEKRNPNVEIDFFSPSDFEAEGIKYQAYNRIKIVGKYDALIVFGGEVIHLYDEQTWKPIYKKNNRILETELPSDIIFDWVNLDAKFKAWISVGVRPIDNKLDFIKISDAIKKLHYISVRGSISKKILEKNILQFNDSKIEITPDLGWLFPNLLIYKNVKGKFYKNFIENDNYLIFQINNINEDEAENIAKYLLSFKKENKIEIYLLPVIRPWEDEKYLELINKKAGNSFIVLPNDLNILELADILVHCKYILCSSLHAAITCLSVGKPAAIINKWQGTKLQDIFGHQFRLNMLRHEIDDIPYLLNELVKESLEGRDNLELYAQFMINKLEKTFDILKIYE